VIRPLPFDEWVRGAAAVAVQTLLFPSDNRHRSPERCTRSSDIDPSCYER
jgi:hypothetical protein